VAEPPYDTLNFFVMQHGDVKTKTHLRPCVFLGGNVFSKLGVLAPIVAFLPIL
jgi:hypothetical protein